ncbi:MAG: hypothetical protein QOG44_781, partial [Acidimicrobiaceae bacterium]|nr:hypothetical protein [Acidimicrobiaceae bacterium]
MNLDEEECWARLAGERHGVLATVHPRRGVDAVPVVFAVLPGGGPGGGGAGGGVGGGAGGGVGGAAGGGAGGGPGGGARSVVIPIDAVKPKRSTRLQRLANIEGDARCVLLVDHYEEDWSQLWWVRLHAMATAWAGSPPGDVIEALSGRYPQYRSLGALVGIITLQPTGLSGWSASGPGGVG